MFDWFILDWQNRSYYCDRCYACFSLHCIAFVLFFLFMIKCYYYHKLTRTLLCIVDISCRVQSFRCIFSDFYFQGFFNLCNYVFMQIKPNCSSLPCGWTCCIWCVIFYWSAPSFIKIVLLYCPMFHFVIYQFGRIRECT